MLDRAGSDQGHAFQPVLRGHVILEHGPLEGVDGLLFAQDGPAQWLVLEDGRLQVIEDDIVRRIARLSQLLQHDLALALQLALLEARVGEDVADDVEGQRHILFQDAGMESGLLAAGIGIEYTAHRFDLFGDVAGAAGGGTLEGHMLQEMRDAHLRRGFIAAAGVDPDAQSRAFELAHGVADHRQAVGKFRYFQDCAAAFSRVKSREDELLYQSRVICQCYHPFGQLFEARQPRRFGRRLPDRLAHRIGKLGRMGGGEDDHR